jgi:hypothetical protein
MLLLFAVGYLFAQQESTNNTITDFLSNLTHKDNLSADTPTATGFLENTANVLILIFVSIFIVSIVLVYFWRRNNRNKAVYPPAYVIPVKGYMPNYQYPTLSFSADVKRSERAYNHNERPVDELGQNRLSKLWKAKKPARTHKNNNKKVPVRQSYTHNQCPSSYKNAVNVYPSRTSSSNYSTVVDMAPVFSIVENAFSSISHDNILDCYYDEDEDTVIPSHCSTAFVSEFPERSSGVSYSDYFTVNRG